MRGSSGTSPKRTLLNVLARNCAFFFLHARCFLKVHVNVTVTREKTIGLQKFRTTTTRPGESAFAIGIKACNGTLGVKRVP